MRGDKSLKIFASVFESLMCTRAKTSLNSGFRGFITSFQTAGQNPSIVASLKTLQVENMRR